MQRTGKGIVNFFKRAEKSIFSTLFIILET
jgi:hypothetical protein